MHRLGRVAGALALASLVLALAPAGARTCADAPVVFAASSLTSVFPRIDPHAKFSFGGSNQLAFQIEQGAPADVFAAASTQYPQKLYKEGLVEQPVVFATNRLVLAVPRSNPAHIRSVFDLRRPGIRLVVGDPAVPVGAYTQRVLGRLGLAHVHVVSREPDVRSILAKIVLGEADAGFVYATDVLTTSGKARAIQIPARAQPRVAYAMAVVRNAPHVDAARAFVFRVLGAFGRRKLAKAGFGLP
jgi:molybdate transport system substrate-binding protein